MRRLAGLAALALLSAPAGAQVSADSGWSAPLVRVHDYEAAVDTMVARSGRASARLAARAAQPVGHVTLQQFVRPDSLRNRRVRVSAWIATRDLGGDGAYLVATAYGPTRGLATADTRAVAATGTTAWREMRLELDVPDSTTGVSVGVFMRGRGTAWVDDVELVPIGPAMPVSTPLLRAPGFEGVVLPAHVLPTLELARPPDDRALGNVVAFVRLTGLVRFFHPALEALGVNWDDFTVQGIRVVEDAPDAAALAERLANLFAPVAPTVEVFASGETPTWRPPAVDPARPGIAHWRHVGVGVVAPPGSLHGPTGYQSVRVVSDAVSDTAPDPREPIRVALGGGVGAIVPLALREARPASADVRARRPNPARAQLALSPNDRATRLAAVGTLWNVMQHFYPYFDVVPTDWMAELPRRLREAAADSTPRQFHDTMLRMVAALHDGHGTVWGTTLTPVVPLPVVLAGAEGHVVVAHVADTTTGLRRGDLLVAVDGAPAADALAREEALVSGSPQWKRHRALVAMARAEAGRRVAWRVRGADGAERAVTLAARPGAPMPREPRPAKVAELRPGVWYVDLDRISDADWADALPKLRRARGIVFDLRGYPNDVATPAILATLARDTIRSPRFELPVATRPDRDGVRWEERGWPVRPAAPRLTARVAWVTDARAISYAETTLGIVEHYRLGAIVGETTAATNGNINPFTLPGGIHVVWTGMRVRRHDGTPHHLVGIRPTVPASRTRAGIAAGRDELLEKAIEVVTR